MWDTGVDIAHKVISAFEKIGGVGKTIWDTIKKAFWGASDWFMRTVITPIINKFAEIRNGFKVSLNAGFRAVLNAVRGPINAMIDGLNSVKNKIPLANMLPNIRSIPAFAQGGITSGPMLAMVGDNPGGREVIAPLDRLQSMLTNAVVQAMGTTNGANTGDIILNIDGRTFARIINPHLAKETQRVGKNVRLKPI
jgi:phage-related protein